VTRSCEHCAASFGIEVFHHGFGDSSYTLLSRVGHDGHPLRAGAIVGQTALSAETSSRHGAVPDAVPMWQQVFEGKHPALAELQAASFRRGHCALNQRYIKENHNHELDVICPAIHAEKIR